MLSKRNGLRAKIKIGGMDVKLFVRTPERFKVVLQVNNKITNSIYRRPRCVSEKLRGSSPQ